MAFLAAAKGRKLFSLAAVCLAASLLLVPSAEASRDLPASLSPTLERLLSIPPELSADPSFELLTDEDRFLFAALSSLEEDELVQILDRRRFRPLSATVSQELASGVSTKLAGSISLRTSDLGWKSHQGDYFLEPDPLGPVDSPNLYQAFGFDGMNITDPYGECLFGIGGTCSEWADAIGGRFDIWKGAAGGWGEGGALSIAADFTVSTALDLVETVVVDPMRVGEATGVAIGSDAGALDVALAITQDVGRGMAIAGGTGAVATKAVRTARAMRQAARVEKVSDVTRTVERAGRRATGAVSEGAVVGVRPVSQSGLSPLSRGARAALERPLERVGQMRLPFRKPLTFKIRSQRTLATATKSYPGVGSSPVGGLVQRASGLRRIKLEQGHVFVQQRWFRPRSPSQWYPGNDLANLGLRRVGNAGWNLMPMPRALNRWLGRHPWASFGFGVGAGGGVGLAGYGGYQFGTYLNGEVLR